LTTATAGENDALFIMLRTFGCREKGATEARRLAAPLHA
jgi:hypothetical protein